MKDPNENKTGYKKTKVGWIPEEWQNEPVGDKCKFSSGNSFRPGNWTDHGLPIIRIQNLNGSPKFNYFAGEVKPEWLVFLAIYSSHGLELREFRLAQQSGRDRREFSIREKFIPISCNCLASKAIL